MLCKIPTFPQADPWLNTEKGSLLPFAWSDLKIRLSTKTSHRRIAGASSSTLLLKIFLNKRYCVKKQKRTRKKQTAKCGKKLKQHASTTEHPFPFGRRELRFLYSWGWIFYRDATYKLINERAHNLPLGTLSSLLLFIVAQSSFVFVC